jgi:transcriptional regulator GlxA family with amidase domain
MYSTIFGKSSGASRSTNLPQVKVDRDVLFVDSGDILTSAGVAAGLDLCLHLVRRDHGSAVANQVARRCVVPPWRDGGQAQYIEQPVPEASSTTTAPALEHLHQPMSLSELAVSAAPRRRLRRRRVRGPGRLLTEPVAPMRGWGCGINRVSLGMGFRF